MSGSVLRGRKRLSLTPSLTKQKKEEIAEGTQTPQRTPRLLKYGLRTPLAEDKSDFEDELSAQKAKGRVQGVLFHNKENVDSNIVPLSTQTSSPVRTPPSTVAAPPLSPVLLPSQPHLRGMRINIVHLTAHTYMDSLHACTRTRTQHVQPLVTD